MFVADYFSLTENQYSFSKQQGSDFAKRIAGDFNPLHDPDNKRFCIPGDLLFSLTLAEHGVSQQMTFNFQGMVSGESQLHFNTSDEQIELINERDKNVLTASRSGEINQDQQFIEALTRSYVAFSGKTFPHIILALMKEEDAMVNPEKPMVIYDQMSLNLERFSESAPEVDLTNSTFDVNGKRGMVTMYFDIKADGELIGRGEKQIIMSGLRPYDEANAEIMVVNYDKSRAAYSE